MTPRRRLGSVVAAVLVAALGTQSALAVPNAVDEAVEPTGVNLETPSAAFVVDHTAGPSNQDLIGMGWNIDSADVGLLADLAPHTIRIDARLERFADPRPSGWADLAEDPAMVSLVRRVLAVRAIGATPHVILSYLPPWLGGYAYGRDATRISPDDLDAWQRLITEVVDEVADAVISDAAGDGSAEVPTVRFEVWNEPDLPIFFQDWPPGFIDMVLRTHQAVADVEATLGGAADLEIGGPATFFPDPVYIGDYVEAVSRAGLPLDFVSWHWYGNTPFLGPDGAEDILPPYLMPAYPVIAQRNPVTSPLAYRWQIDEVRAVVDAVLAGRAGYDPELVIDEWNLSAGGFDHRHDTDEGAAFALASLIVMEEAGLDGADFYRGIGSDTPGDWGMVTTDGVRKPSYWVFDAWRRTAGTLLANPMPGGVNDDRTEGLFSRGTISDDGRRIDVLLANFRADEGEAHRDVVAGFVGWECQDDAIVVLSRLDGSDPMVLDGETPPTMGGAPMPTTIWVFDLPAQTSRHLVATCND